MLLSALAILIGGTIIWRGRFRPASNAADLRRAAASINRQVLILGVTLFAATLPGVRLASELWAVAALALSGIFALVLFCLRERWTSRVRVTWESSVQQSIHRTMLPPPAVHIMPSTPVRMREAA